MYFTRPFWLLPVYYSTNGGYWDRFRVCVQYVSVPENSEAWSWTKAEPTLEMTRLKLATSELQAGLTWNHAGVKCANIFADLVVLSIFRIYKSSTRFILPLHWSCETGFILPLDSVKLNLAWNWVTEKGRPCPENLHTVFCVVLLRRRRRRRRKAFFQTFCVFGSCFRTPRHAIAQSVTIIIIMYIYDALINALSAHMIHINLNMIFYTHAEHSPTKTIYMKYYQNLK